MSPHGKHVEDLIENSVLPFQTRVEIWRIARIVKLLDEQQYHDIFIEPENDLVASQKIIAMVEFIRD